MKKLLLGAAVAAQPAAGCGYRSLLVEGTGNYPEGMGYGYVHDAGGGPVTVRCTLLLNGGEVLDTPTGTGDGAAATVARWTFAAQGTDTLQVCVHAMTPSGPIDRCGGLDGFAGVARICGTTLGVAYCYR